MPEHPSSVRRYVVLPLAALVAPAAISIATVVLFWTYPMSVLAVVLFGVAIGVLLQAESARTITLFAVPTIAWAAWLLFFPLSERGYGPALTQFVMLNLAVFLAVVVAIRLKQRALRA
ncbi:MAG: hypothetical protein WD929_08295 [Steroidobacteraceae bacterium]